ncbi:DNA methyltransferase [Botrimarina sp.]|uniref:Eco57I restriction-modification methylase domain-containing protein n=1 Tax=Botrimarina sp. TaxID=2795802 RepID=UPI0032EEFF11
MARTPEPIAWLSLVDVSGPFLAGTVLEDAFPQGLDKIETPRRQRLRAAYEEWQDAIDENDPHLDELHDAWVRMVLQEGLEYESESLSSKDQLPERVVYHSPEQGVEYSPDFAVRSGDGSLRLLITVHPPGTNLDNPLPKESWPASPAERMTLLCRANECRIGLITNGQQWMLVNAPIGETSGYASWYARLWWQEPVTLKAFQSLLGVRRCFGPEEDTLPRLLERSLEFQEEVTNTLGEQVRSAVEVLIQSLGRADQDRNGELLKEVAPAELYEAGLTVMMRLVFILSAEERGLLLLGDPVYDQHYAVSTLRAKLREDADQYGLEVLERRHDAWSRLLATFRAIYGGVEHEALRLPALGGSLFDPDRFPFLEGRPQGTKWREQPAVPLPIDNRTVLLLMTALQILEQRGGALLLSYRALDVEQIGHVYEGLLEFTAARVPEITLGLIGTKKLPNPQITLSELESLATKDETFLLDHLKEITGRSLPALRKAIRAEESPALFVALVQSCNGDEQFARRLLPFGELIRSDSWGSLLVYQKASFAIVKGTDRRSSGTHYTPRSLTEPIARYTLEPLVYVGPSEGHPQEEWKLKSSADILALNVCDMACGSGAFLVEACRYLSQRLVEAWTIEETEGLAVGIDGIARTSSDEHEALPKNLDDRLLIARRLVAQSCLYGVDVNHLAVELAKLSIWLVTLAKNKPFNFLDHALRCGDSLIGLHDLEQLRFYSLKPDAEHPVLFKGPLNTAVDDAIALRLRLEGTPANTVADVEAQERLLEEAEEKVARLRCAADLLVSAEFWGEGNADKQERSRHAAVKSGYYVEKGPTEEFKKVAVQERHGQKMFHWPLEFPEVIVKRGGFDAFVGNPPFAGGRRIRSTLGEQVLLWLTSSGCSANADLCAFFFLRSFVLSNPFGGFGLLATNTIAQGDTREVGLDALLASGASIPRAVRSRQWPGNATVEVSHVWVTRKPWKGTFILDDKSVGGITSMLTEPGAVTGKPFRLQNSMGIAFQGCVVLGKGFLLDEQEARTLLSNKHNKDVVLPYLNGADLNSSPTHQSDRWVINFFDWPLNRQTAPPNYTGPVAADYPECLSILSERVRSERSAKGGEVAAAPWWQFWRSRPDLASTSAGMEWVLVRSRVSNINSIAFVQNGIVFSDATVVFAWDCYSQFALLQSAFHTEWLTEYASSMRTDVRYTPTDCFETFAFPATTEAMTATGERYYEHRGRIMLSREEGLTKTYNRFHDRYESSVDIQKLRELHVEMDQAVAAAYGWDDLDLGHGFHETKQRIRFSIGEPARREVLQRLLRLNHERYEEEVRQGLHSKTSGKKKASKRSKQPDLFEVEDA